MPRYREKSATVEAFQMTKERRLDNSEWPEWLSAAWQKDSTAVGALFCSSNGCLAGEKYTPLFIQTDLGTKALTWNDYIVQGDVFGRCVLYLVKFDEFETTYEIAGDE